MGACCEAKHVSTELQDLPAPKANPKDSIAVWEATLPFARCSMKAYDHHLSLAHGASGGNGIVTLASLASNFTSPAWRDLKNADSALVSYLKIAC